MNTNKMKLGSLFFALMFLVPVSSEAYFTTSQTATKLTENVALYTISFDFGFPSRELYMPIGALRDSGADISPYIEYEILDDDDSVVTEGKAAGLILAQGGDVEIKDNQYYLPAGKSARFTLFALLSIEDNLNEIEANLHINSLPFTMVDEGNKIHAKLNPSELQYYVTPTVSFPN